MGCEGDKRQQPRYQYRAGVGTWSYDCCFKKKRIFRVLLNTLICVAVYRRCEDCQPVGETWLLGNCGRNLCPWRVVCRVRMKESLRPFLAAVPRPGASDGRRCPCIPGGVATTFIHDILQFPCSFAFRFPVLRIALIIAPFRYCAVRLREIGFNPFLWIGSARTQRAATRGVRARYFVHTYLKI